MNSTARRTTATSLFIGLATAFTLAVVLVEPARASGGVTWFALIPGRNTIWPHTLGATMVSLLLVLFAWAANSSAPILS